MAQGEHVSNCVKKKKGGFFGVFSSIFQEVVKISIPREVVKCYNVYT